MDMIKQTKIERPSNEQNDIPVLYDLEEKTKPNREDLSRIPSTQMGDNFSPAADSVRIGGYSWKI